MVMLWHWKSEMLMLKVHLRGAGRHNFTWVAILVLVLIELAHLKKKKKSVSLVVPRHCRPEQISVRDPRYLLVQLAPHTAVATFLFLANQLDQN